MAALKSVKGFAAHDSSGVLKPFEFSRRATGTKDVVFKVKYCGVCHSDLHQMRNEWNSAVYPMVPGHEIVGIVTEVGSEVSKFKIGDHVGVGCMVMSCGACSFCKKQNEQHCSSLTWTYNSIDLDGTLTYGGYSDLMVANEKFVLRIPENLPLDGAAPLLCAGVTVYSPMSYFGMTEPGKHLGVVGLGGLGHMAIKFGKAFGLKVTVISTSPKKKEEALKNLGADAFVISKDMDEMKGAANSMDYILDTVSASHDLEQLMTLLVPDGRIVLLGIPPEPFKINPFSLIIGRRSVTGSDIGSIHETQEMLDFCGQKNITSTIEKISIDYLNMAMDRLVNADVKYRFVIDLDTIQRA
ncbi:hypothetical protein KP509_21G021300 [Ceratopteris richardii]|uniref:Enoyl reductase (ER) domain-containing protein n=1 Tax=Ceratopteris richardii TaxID=49495 RepID=A0A8T2SBH4_CERRI|nr:hypothetical protein KP509_21G021300 [Ceratopteris richardii]KAH7314807.1 hypothetical protein KP509_21G021300 [Ceratopteris richardii]